MQGGKRGGEREEGGEGGRRVHSSEYNNTDANANVEREGGGDTSEWVGKGETGGTVLVT
jgi:hypothetical protein